MKKITVLFLSCAAAIMLVAAPQTKLATLSPDADTKLHPQVLHALTHDLSKRALPANQEVVRQAPQHRLAPCAKATTETINLTGDGFLVGPEYEVATGEWYIALEAQGYTFRLCWYGDEDDYCGTYTFDDMSMDYSWGWYQSADMFYEIYFQDVTMTISEKVEGSLKQIVLDATILDTNDRTYQVHAVHSSYSPKTIVESVLDNSKVTMDFGYYVLEGSNNDLSVKLGVISDVIEGEYTKANFDMNQTKIIYNGVEQQMLQANMMIGLSELENGALGYEAALHFYNQDTVLHKVQMTVPLPAAKDTIKVACHNLSVDESFADYGFVMLFASNTDYDIFAMYEDDYAEAGVYDVALTVTDKKTWLDCSSIRGTLTLKETAEGWEANIEAYCDDYNWYSIDMNFEVPVPTKTVKVEFENSALASFRADQLNMIQLIQYADDYEASITIYNTGLGESFNMEKVLMDYTEFYDWTGESSVEIADIKGVLNQRGDTTVINASYIGFNAVQYDVEFWYVVPTPIDTVEIEMPVKFTNTLQDGYYILSSYTPDNSIFISLSPLTDGEVAGTYINDGLFGKFGAEGGRYDFYSGNTFIYVESEWQNYTIEKGELLVEHAKDGTIIADAKFIARNGVYYHVKMTSEYNSHLDFDEPEEIIDRVYTTADNVTIDDQTMNNGYIYLALTAADGSDMAAFFFFAEETDEDIIVPVGVYPIDSSEEYGTVFANPGVQGDGVWPSYYARMLEDGSLITPLWLLVDGTVEVRKDEEGNAHLEVNAVNSYGVEVHIVYDGTPIDTSVENTHSQSPMTHSQKLLRNGQLLIQRAGETFTILGTRIAQ
ncbi:MAG: hypothetical protein U0L47_04545 [Paludibacteraceae bacterium]|nr:hypothetical protein [Paludibacteraceae bacterium]